MGMQRLIMDLEENIIADCIVTDTHGEHMAQLNA
jgi:hypothetical protein